MRNAEIRATSTLVLIGLLCCLPVRADLTVTAVPGIPEDSAVRNDGGKAGWTLVASGNTKGQTVVFEHGASLSGVVLQIAELTARGDVTLELHGLSQGLPAGDALHSETGPLPVGLAEGGFLRFDFASPLALAPGEYAIVVRTDAAQLRFRLNQSDGYEGGRLVRTNATTGSLWRYGAGDKSDLVFALLGTMRAPFGVTLLEPPPASVAPTEASPPSPMTPQRVPFLTPRSALPGSPNIVIYMIDDLGWNQISAGQVTMGTHTGVFRTPHIEELASNGLSFTHAYAQPNCAPTRAAMLSGQYPARVNNSVYVVGNLNRHGRGGITKQQAKFAGPKQSEDVAPEAITIAEAMKENGYVTAHIGKYHVGGHRGDATLPENVGFDINIGGFRQGHQPVCFATKKNDRWMFRNLGRGDFDRFGEPYTKAYVEKYEIPAEQIGKPKHVSDALCDAMEETLGKLYSTGKPFYLQLHAYAVHGPVKSRPDLKAAALERLAEEDNKKAELAGFVASVDNTLARLLAAVDDPNGDGDTADSVAKNTVILFTSDNGGTHFDNLPLRGKKGMFTEGGVRVPLIAYWPGVIPANTVTDHMVHSVDYYPTCLELAGNQWRPPEAKHPLDGESFADVLRKPDTPRDRGPVFYLFPGYMDTRAQPCVVAIDELGGKRYKLLHFYETGAWELYNLTDDVGEAGNLIQTSPELASTLSQKMNAWLTQEHSTWKPRFPLDKQSGRPVGPPPPL